MQIQPDDIVLVYLQDEAGKPHPVYLLVQGPTEEGYLTHVINEVTEPGMPVQGAVVPIQTTQVVVIWEKVENGPNRASA